MPEKILIVDDDLDTLKLVGLMLQRQGYDIVAANTGSRGYEKAVAERPDLILLDVMMPDMDGYEVTRQIRRTPELAGIPIIMFTAKSMVDDKVAGFEAGVDDYMAKPTHPAELISRVRALLARADSGRIRSTGPTPKTGRLVGFVGAKGGVGTTTIVFNVGVVAAQQVPDRTILLAEMYPGLGSLALMSGLDPDTGLARLLKLPVTQITTRTVEEVLVQHATGFRALLASSQPQDYNLVHTSAQQAEVVARTLTRIGDLTILDFGAGVTPISHALMPKCDELMVVLEPTRTAVNMTLNFVRGIEKMGVQRSRLAVIMLNRSPSSMQLSRKEVEDILGLPFRGLITPNPELAYQAAEKGQAMVTMRQDSLIADQYRKIGTDIVAPVLRTPVN
mgnify:CR=1 FL=1